MNKRIAKLLKDPPSRVSKAQLNTLEQRMVVAQKNSTAKARQLDSGKVTTKDREEFLKLALEDRDAMIEFMLSGGERKSKTTKKQTKA